MSLPPNSLPTPQTYTEMTSAGNELPGWLWRGFIAFGSITLLTNRWKTGKTTLLSVLLSRLQSGGIVAGSEAVAAAALIVSEESQALWVERGRKTPFGPNVRWLCRPFAGKPTRDQWLNLINQVAELTAGTRTLIVIDPLAMVLPGMDENNAGPIIDALTPLHRLTAAGHAVLLLHHPRKGATLEPRGSGAITGVLDILIQMDTSPDEKQHPNRRWLRGRGRVDGVVRERLIELNAEHTDYTVPDADAEDLTDGWSIIEWVLKDARDEFTRDRILKNWPEMRNKPHPASLWKWLEQARTDGRVERDGEGRPYKPFRYWLRSREQHFLPDLPELPFAYDAGNPFQELERIEKILVPHGEKRKPAKGKKGPQTSPESGA